LRLTLGKAVISASAFGAITTARRRAMTSADDKEGTHAHGTGANAQVKRQAEARELPVYFLVCGARPCQRGASGMSRTNASCKSRLTRHLESTLIADDRQ
jgi:hypothetical protein